MTYFALYLLLCWSVLATITWGMFPGATTVLGAVALYTSAPIFVFIKRFKWAFYPGALFRLLVIRVLLYAQLMLPFVTIAGVLGGVVGLPLGAAVPVARVFAGVMFVAALVLFLAGYVGSRSLVTRNVEARIKGLPVEFDGLRIVQLSDLHVGPQSSRTFLARVVRVVTSLKPDVIAVTGDLIDDRPEDVEVYARALGSLEAPLGVFMIPGNHDVYAGWSDVERALHKQVRGHVLVNDMHLLQRGSASIALVGTGDPAGTQRGVGALVGPDIPRALARVPADSTVIALAHNPALWPALVQHNVALTLSGHTHWGQLAFPKRGWSLASRFLKYAMGQYHERNSLLYISPGTGYWGIPFRIGARPEVTVVTLHAAEQSGISMSEPVSVH